MGQGKIWGTSYAEKSHCLIIPQPLLSLSIIFLLIYVIAVADTNLCALTKTWAGYQHLW